MSLRRLLVLWLLIVAMPMQAFAASARLHCVAAQVGDVGAGHASHASAGAHDHHASSGHPAGTEAVAAPAGLAAIDAMADASDEARPDRTVDGRCTACAMCHLGIALPTASEILPQPPRDPLARSEGFTSVRSLALPPLERPPRPTLV